MLFTLYVITCYVSAYCACFIDPGIGEGDAELITPSKVSVKAGFALALIPILNFAPIYFYIKLNIPHVKLAVLTKVREILEKDKKDE